MMKLGVKVPQSHGCLPDEGAGGNTASGAPYARDIVTTWRRCQWGKLGNLGKAERNRDAAWLTATHHIEKFDETTVMMLLSFQAKKEGKIKQGGLSWWSF